MFVAAAARQLAPDDCDTNIRARSTPGAGA